MFDLITECQEKNDAEVVELTLDNQSYFLVLMKRYEQALLRYIFRISSFSTEEAEDVLQDVFIKVYRNLNSYDTGLKFSSWIYRVTHNEVISRYRKEKSRGTAVNWEINEDILNSLAADLDISRDLDLDFLSQEVKVILNELDNKYREVLVLKFLEEKDYKEISDILKKPIGTVGTLVNRAKKQFKNIWQTSVKK